ncbi:MAG: hypothetical protein V4702_04850 [Patescibacteria group bacterium]
MDTQKTQITDRLKQATNILVTVSANPSVDQLAGAVGLTLLLNKLGKHATAVFSGQIPSTLEFLQPDKTLEKNTDSLRDFIIALDKTKADKLRYKVEDQMVKIFITPYRTSISDKDLEFSQGDFNVEVVFAIGVNQQQDLDQAIITHGRILHDATVISVNKQDGASLGSINWVQADTSSLCEMLVDLGLSMKADVIDGQMATAFLTGIVAETDRFSNEKTSSQTMALSAKLMAAGANQQLIASQLEPVTPVVNPAPAAQTPPVDKSAELPEIVDTTADSSQQPAPESKKSSDGSLEIDHGEPKLFENDAEISEELEAENEEDKVEQIHIDAEGQLKAAADMISINQKVIEPLAPTDEATNKETTRLVLEPPTLGGKLTANSVPEALDPSVDPLASASGVSGPTLSHAPTAPADLSIAMPPLSGPAPITTPALEDIIGSTSSITEDTSVVDTPEPPQPSVQPVMPSTDNTTTDSTSASTSPPSDTLSDLEKVVDSPHLDQVSAMSEEQSSAITNSTDVTAARDAVMNAVSGTTPQVLEPIQSLNAAPMDLNLGDMPAVATSPLSAFSDQNLMPPSPSAFAPPSTEAAVNPNQLAGLNLTDPGMPRDNTAASVSDPTAPPTVPPPLLPPNEPTMTYGQQSLPNAEDDNQSTDPMGPL